MFDRAWVRLGGFRGRGACARGAAFVVATMKPAGTTAPFTDVDLPGASSSIARAPGRSVARAVALPYVFAEPAACAGLAD